MGGYMSASAIVMGILVFVILFGGLLFGVMKMR
jgi:hypothetical protein